MPHTIVRGIWISYHALLFSVSHHIILFLMFSWPNLTHGFAFINKLCKMLNSSNILANTAALFHPIMPSPSTHRSLPPPKTLILKMAIAVFTSPLENLQYCTWLIFENQNLTTWRLLDLGFSHQWLWRLHSSRL